MRLELRPESSWILLESWFCMYFYLKYQTTVFKPNGKSFDPIFHRIAAEL